MHRESSDICGIRIWSALPNRGSNLSRRALATHTVIEGGTRITVLTRIAILNGSQFTLATRRIANLQCTVGFTLAVTFYDARWVKCAGAILASVAAVASVPVILGQTIVI